MLCRTTLLSISLLSLAAQAQAQSNSSQPAAVAPTVAVAGYPGYYGHSSTLQEGVQHGYADVLRAEGEQAYNIARAADQFETAREKSLKNHQQAVQQYFALRTANQEYRKGQQAKVTSKIATQAKASLRSAAPLAVVRYDGQIEWPVALEGAAVAGSRKQLERLFSQRAAGHEIRSGSKEYRQGCQAIEKIQADLKDSIDTLPSTEYMAARKMLQSLRHELSQPTDTNLLTQQ